MKIKIFLILILSISAFTTSCSPKLATIPIEPERSYETNYDKTWSAVITALTELNFPIDVLDKESGLINTKEILTSTMGFMRSAHLYGIRGSMGSRQELASAKALVKKENEKKTKVRIIVNIKEQDSWYNYFNEESNGNLEKKIYDKIQQSL